MSDWAMLLLTIGGLALLMVIVLFLPQRIQRRTALVASMWCWVGVGIMQTLSMLFMYYGHHNSMAWFSSLASVALILHVILLFFAILPPSESGRGHDIKDPAKDGSGHRNEVDFIRGRSFKALYIQQRREMRALRQQLSALEGVTSVSDQDGSDDI